MSPPVVDDNEDLREISGVLELNAVNEVSVIPNKGTIMNHHDVKVNSVNLTLKLSLSNSRNIRLAYFGNGWRFRLLQSDI